MTNFKNKNTLNSINKNDLPDLTLEKANLIPKREVIMSNVAAKEKQFLKAFMIGSLIFIATITGLYAFEAMANVNAVILQATRSGVSPIRTALEWLQPYLCGIASIASMFYIQGDLWMRGLKAAGGCLGLYAVSSAIFGMMPAVQ